MSYSHHKPRTLLAGLVLLAGPAAAQAPQPAPPPPPAPPAAITSPSPALPAAAPNAATAPNPAAVPAVVPGGGAVPEPGIPAPPAAIVDPQVTALFNQAIAAHKALSALSATVTVSSVGLGPSDQTQTITLAYKKPSFAKFTVAGAAGQIVRFYANSKTVAIYFVQNKKYRVDPIPAGALTIPLILDQTRALLPRLLGHPESLGELLAQPGVTATVVASGTTGDSASFGGAAVDTVVATLPAPDGSKAAFTFRIGRADHLLRQIVENATLTSKGVPQTFTLTQTVTVLEAAPVLTAADFKFTPPPGVTKITPPAPVKKTGQNTPPAEPLMHDPRLVPGAKPFPVTAADLSGKPLTLAQYKGKVVLMDFWATWCGPCVGEMPNVIAAYKKYHAQGFDIVGISLDQSRPALTAFIAQNQMPWRQVFDGKYWSSAVPREYGVQAIPFGLLIGRDGQIAAVDVRGPALTAAIQAALAK